jgi:hypothetical protein
METAKARLKEAIVDHQKAQEENQKAEDLFSEAENFRRKVEGDLSYISNSLPPAVEKVRTAAIGVVIPSVQLGDGKRLTQAQIKKVDDTGISFIHSEGFGMVPLENLPQDLVEKYDLGPGSLAKQAEKLRSEALKIAADETRAATDQSAHRPSTMINNTTINVSGPSAKKVVPVVDETKLKNIDLQIADTTAQINAALRNKAGWQETADNYSRQVYDAGVRGVPTTKLREAEANARNQLALTNQQINKLEAELRRLEVERNAVARGAK